MDRRSNRRTFAAFLTDFVGYGIAMSAISMVTYLPLFLKTNGASTVVIGLVPAAFAVGRMTGLLAAPRLECRALIQRWMVKTMVVERLPLCLCGVWIVLGPANRPDTVVAGVLVLWVTYTLVNGWASAAWSAYVARALSVQERGQLHGLGNAFGALSSLAVVPLVRASIDRFGLSPGYGGAVALAGLLLACCALVFLRAGEEPYAHVKARVGLGAYFRSMAPVLCGDRRFRWFLTVMTLWLVGTTGTAYFTVYAMDRFGAGPDDVMGYTIAMSLGAAVAGLAGGHVAARAGFCRVFAVGMGLTALSMLAAFLALRPWVVYPAFLLAGAGGTAAWMAVMNLPLELADRRDVPTYAAVAALVRGPAGALAPLAAGAYLERFPYPPLFLFCAGISLRAVWLLARHGGEPRRAAVPGPLPAVLGPLARTPGRVP
ncbi:MAG: MFS transporter [Candidatus Latescibacterota bacterium]